MCYPICTRERDIPVQSSSSSSSFWKFWGWSRATSALLAILWKIDRLCFGLIAITNRADRDLLKNFSSLTLPDRDHYISCSRSDYDFLQNDLLCFSKTSFHDFHDSYIKPYTKLKLKSKTKTKIQNLKLFLAKIKSKSKNSNRSSTFNVASSTQECPSHYSGTNSTDDLAWSSWPPKYGFNLWPFTLNKFPVSPLNSTAPYGNTLVTV